jgi:hypothetical protein
MKGVLMFPAGDLNALFGVMGPGGEMVGLAVRKPFHLIRLITALASRKLLKTLN